MAQGDAARARRGDDLSSTHSTETPALTDVTVTFAAGADTTPPTITGRTPSPDSTDVPRGSNVEVQFSEAMDPGTIDGTSLRLRRQGAGSDVAANVTSSGATATLNPDADLAAGAVYEVTVAGSVEDANGNALGTDDTWTFTTAPLTFTDTTVADFSGGTTDANTYVSQTDDGEVTLKPTVGEEFWAGRGCPPVGPRLLGPVVAGRPSRAGGSTSTADSPARIRRSGRAARSSSSPRSAPRPSNTWALT